MSTRLPDDELLKLIHLLKDRSAALPAATGSDLASIQTRRDAILQLIGDLERGHGAKFNTRWNGATLVMAGIRATSTSGPAGAMQNWITAAYRELDRRRAA
ncbi:hypothetical protein MKI84_13005 [Ancylobacter sp. A5.8]|uniref:hypothetical protein n=1 Tax=Ancylobacter gelatini TaxID=2919920 RepID=UPI001F4D851E|nr:hypothetical protein [Ancylobacter gelatini]MCJ8143836.1 hypothetical protein [Ancylobacter gelatini]